MRLISLIFCVGFAPALIAASHPIRLQPSSPWDVDYAENSCRLIRTFGEGKTLTKLAFESTTPGSMDMLVTGKPVKTYLQTVPARFAPNEITTFDGTAAQTTSGDPAMLWSSVQLYPADVVARLKAESVAFSDGTRQRPRAVSLAEQATRKAERQAFVTAASEIEVLTIHNRPVILETGSLGDAFKAFDQCSEDSLAEGVDPRIEEKIVRPVWAENPGQWISYRDYPADMAERGKESAVAIRLLIDASGKVTKCTSVSHYREAEFNKITCDLVTLRGRFEPAELADGTKVPSYYAQRVIFRMAP